MRTSRAAQPGSGRTSTTSASSPAIATCQLRLAGRAALSSRSGGGGAAAAAALLLDDVLSELDGRRQGVLAGGR
jgi:recombinational DNA repair ATPase RecF